MSNQIQIETQKDREKKVLPVKSVSGHISNIEFVKKDKTQIELVSDSESSSASEMEIPNKNSVPISKKHSLPPTFANTLMNPLKARTDMEPEVTDHYISESDESYESSSDDNEHTPVHSSFSTQQNIGGNSAQEQHNPESDKQEIFLKLMALKNKGVVLSKNFSPNSDYAELKLEYDRQNKMLRNEAGIKFARRMLMGCVTGMEFMNKRFDPVGAKLDGWSENVMENISEYDDVFEKLYEKYSSDTEMAPEFQLLFTLGGSAFMFHLTNTMFKNNLPNVSHAPAYIPEPMNVPRPAESTRQSDTAGIFKQTNKQTPVDMPGPSSNILSGLPNIADAIKKGPSVPVISRPETITPPEVEDDRFSDGTDSKLSDLSEVRSVSINLDSLGKNSTGKNKITIGR